MGYHLPWVAKNKKISSDMLCRWCEKENFLIFLVFTNLLWTLLFLHSPLLKEVCTKLIFFLTCEEIFKKKPILLLWLSRFVSCSKFFPSVLYLFFQFSRARKLSWKGHKFSAFGLKLAQPFLNTAPALKS